jgi:hypothetical protein
MVGCHLCDGPPRPGGQGADRCAAPAASIFPLWLPTPGGCQHPPAGAGACFGKALLCMPSSLLCLPPGAACQARCGSMLGARQADPGGLQLNAARAIALTMTAGRDIAKAVKTSGRGSHIDLSEQHSAADRMSDYKQVRTGPAATSAPSSWAVWAMHMLARLPGGHTSDRRLASGSCPCFARPQTLPVV